MNLKKKKKEWLKEIEKMMKVTLLYEFGKTMRDAQATARK